MRLISFLHFYSIKRSPSPPHKDLALFIVLKQKRMELHHAHPLHGSGKTSNEMNSNLHPSVYDILNLDSTKLSIVTYTNTLDGISVSIPHLFQVFQTFVERKEQRCLLWRVANLRCESPLCNYKSNKLYFKQENKIEKM